MWRADIAPPADYPKALRAEFVEMRAEANRDARAGDKARYTNLLERWAEQVAWWEQRHDAPKRVPNRNGGATEMAMAPAYVSPPLSAPPPPPPAPVVAPPPPTVERSLVEADADASQAVVITGSRGSLGGEAPAAPAIAIDVLPPDRPYLKVLDAAGTDGFRSAFSAQEALYGTLPAFYLDVADWLWRRGRRDEARETVLSALELASANEVTLGIVADRMERYGELDRAVELRERHAALDASRPQPRRALALALARRAGQGGPGERADLQRAFDLLAAIARDPLDGRWMGVDLIALMEANALIPRLRQLGGTVALDPRLIRLLDSDLRVVIDWTTDATDIDLWVDEPTGERAKYSNPRTALGGHLSNDMTSGYGPEEYFLHRARTGTYAVQAHVYAPDRIDPNGRSVLTARLIRDWGRPNQTEEVVDLELAVDEYGERRIGQLIVRSLSGGH